MQNVGKAIVAVAHPDDCVIFALPLIEKYSHFNWHIVYLTYKDTDPRAQEVRNFWNKRNISTEFLGFIDDYHDQELQKLNFWAQADAEIAIGYAVTRQDPVLVVTHNIDGDYGHIHHRIVHAAISVLDIPQIYFASTFNYTEEIRCRESYYSLDELPLHRDVIADFQDRLIGRYIISDSASRVLNA